MIVYMLHEKIYIYIYVHRCKICTLYRWFDVNYGRRSMDLWTGSWMIREFDRWTDIYNIDFDKLSGSL